MTTARFADWTALEAESRMMERDRAVARAAAMEPRLNAYVALGTTGTPQTGPLGGMPYAVKDLLRTKTRQPTGGTSGPLALDAQSDLIDRIDAAGGALVGYTGMTELAYEPSGYNAVHGRVKNPWNLDFVSGGSSSGSAAAVASGSAVVALGSDTGGSLRIPAHCCGVTAWKPSWGIVSDKGAMPLAPFLDTIGLLARSASDIAMAADVLADHLPPAQTPIRRAVVAADVLDAAEPSIRRACQDGIAAIEACGVSLTHTAATMAIEAADRHALVVMQAEAARAHRSRLDDAHIDPVLRKRLAKGLSVSDDDASASRALRASLAQQFADAVLGDAEVAILPVMTIPTPRAEICDPASPSFTPRTLYEMSRWTRFVNMLGVPAVALPVGFDLNGMPVALQIVGKIGTDNALIALAQAVQNKTDWHRRIPHAVADLA